MSVTKGYEFLCPHRVVGETFVTKGKNTHACCGEHRANKSTANKQDVNAHRLMEAKHFQAFRIQFTCRKATITVIHWNERHT
jgi:hypothetical protein